MSKKILPLHLELNQKYQEFSSTVVAWKLLKPALLDSPWLALDLGRNNQEILNLGLKDSMHPLGGYIDSCLAKAQAKVAYGGWQEDRMLYELSPHFASGSGSRSVHLGVDLWFPIGQEILCPYPATLHSFQNNNNFLDYGPTLILEHQITSDFKFFSLYGHLAPKSLDAKKVGQKFEVGETIAWLGAPPDNGDWPAHLHFQIILDMLDKSGDYAGVSSLEDREFFRCLCPDPSLVLKPNFLA